MHTLPEPSAWGNLICAVDTAKLNCKGPTFNLTTFLRACHQLRRCTAAGHASPSVPALNAEP